MKKNKYIVPTINVVNVESATLMAAVSSGWTPNGDKENSGFGIVEEDPSAPKGDDSFGAKDNNSGSLWDE
ncbi:hypothetical protein [uncultured Prevotella sp.]|uniref:hypothetical protein n=1 Tax=uncultured Prevotella sp. TaxID=159272 RepID=UPI00261A6A80|nr:hypothetical protein [uncultured Prevotella sp.]